MSLKFISVTDIGARGPSILEPVNWLMKSVGGSRIGP